MRDKILLGTAAVASASAVIAMPSLISRSTPLGPTNLLFSAHENGFSQYDSASYASFGNAFEENYLTTAANKSQAFYLRELSARTDGTPVYGQLALDSSLSQCVTATATDPNEMTGFGRSACKDVSDVDIKWQTFFLDASQVDDGFNIRSIVFDPTGSLHASPSPVYKYSLFPQAHDPAADIKAEQCSVTGSQDCPAGWVYTLSFDAVLKT